MEQTVKEKLDNLLHLQSIDKELDKIQKLKGDLPEEVQELEDGIAGYQTRMQKYNDQIEELNEEIGRQRTAIKDAEKFIERYKDQQMSVRNNREYEAIAKEIESHQLDIQLAEKAIKETEQKIEQKKTEIEELNKTIEEAQTHLSDKKQELETLNQESANEEADLLKKREKAKKGIEDRLVTAYQRIRDNARNGLAVVRVERGACGGCFAIVPPQRQVDIREQKKIIVCEHCGRILADAESLAEREPEPKKRSGGKKRSTKKSEKSKEA